MRKDARQPKIILQAAALMFVAAVVSIFGRLLGEYFLTTGLALLSLSPLLALWLIRIWAGSPLLFFDPPLIISGSFAVFFAAGAFASRDATGIPYVSHGSQDGEFLLNSLILLSVAAGVMTSFAHLGSRFPWRVPILAMNETPVSNRSLNWFAQLLFFITAAGVLSALLALGGPSRASEILSSHNKMVIDAAGRQPGLSIWALLALPTCLALYRQFLEASMSYSQRTLVLVELTALLSVAVFVFGSRLLLILVGIGCLAMYCVRNVRAVPWKLVVMLAVGIVLVSFPLQASRGGISQQSVADVVGYRIFDVSIASLSVEARLGPSLNNSGRYLTIASSAIPLLGASSTDLSPLRADALVVKYIGGGGTQRALATGFPPSLPTALLVMFGHVGGVLAAAIFGLLVAATWTVLRKYVLTDHSGLGLLILGFAAATIFNMFKGGDFAIDLASLVKQLAILAVLYFAVYFFVGSKSARTPHA